MAEVKNNFLGAKMNRDVDDRLLPSNEYREAFNLQINRSEDSDVGTLQSVLGNSLVANFNNQVVSYSASVGTVTGTGPYTATITPSTSFADRYIKIGSTVLATAGNPSSFVSGVVTSIATSGNNVTSFVVSSPNVFTAGNITNLTAVLNLECIGSYVDNSTNNIYVFLTDNSSIKYNKNANNYVCSYNTLEKSTANLVQGPFLNFSTLNPVLGINLIEELLFWTDNRNQPRRINVNEASSSVAYYTQEKQISVAKMNPLYPMELYRLSTLEGAPVGLSGYETSMLDVVSEYLPDEDTLNPYKNSAYAGDPTYLEDKLVRFSYRYRFEDGEYSIMAPFTQIAYIPKQDGYFLQGDEADTYRSTTVKFMRNKVNNIFLQIRLPSAANLLASECKISFIEILYKDANSLAVNAVDTISVEPIQGSFFNTSETVYSYNYQSKKPFKTLPERDLIRVYDKTPIKAFGQEVVGNRVVYSNYQGKSSYPKYLNYNVGYGDKYPFGFSNAEGTSIKEYPNHSVKQNRNYQVGIVFGDKFGRESGVILSDRTTQEGISVKFGSSSLYAPYLLPSDTDAVKPSSWPGNSLKVLFNETISPTQPNSTTGWPGIYNGDDTSDLYNPLGWYSYKIVVKQTEQEYYNVYLPGVMASYPTNATLEIGKTSHAVLLNDNINKIPRDLAEVGPAQLQFRSSVTLYPRVNNNDDSWKNEMFYPRTSYCMSSTIADNNSLFFSGLDTIPSLTEGYYPNFYQIDSNPLIVRIATPDQLGVIPSYIDPAFPSVTTNVINLAVLETKPVESKLDIYWETSSVGVISELNIAIDENAEFTIKEMIGFTFDLSEAAFPGDFASDEFWFTDVADSIIVPTSVSLISVKTQDGTPVDSFEIQPINSTNFRLKVKPGKYFYYGADADLNAYTFEIRATIGTPEISKSFIRGGEGEGELDNVLPNITTFPTEPINMTTGELDIFTFVGNNGSNPAGGKSTIELTWGLIGSSKFTITQTGELKTNDPLIEGTYNLTVGMTEASGEYVTKSVTVIYTPVNAVIFDGPDYSEGSGYFSGTITVKGADATFRVYAQLNNEGDPVYQNASILLDCDGNDIEVENGEPNSIKYSTESFTLTGGLGDGTTYPYGMTIAISPIGLDAGRCGISWTQ